MNKFLAVLLSGLLACFHTGAFSQGAQGAQSAQTPQEAAVRKLIQPKVGADTVIDKVTKTPYSGLYEVQVGSHIFYTDEQAKYLFVGRVLDAASSKDYTRERLEQLNRIKFSSLPLDSAVKMVKGNGKRVIAVFEDPNCIYCKRLGETLTEMNNVTVYTFMYNILSEDSAKKSHNIWCSKDRRKAWDDWMVRAKEPAAAAAGCASPNEAVFELGRKLQISGTPTIFYADGTRSSGFLSAKDLEARLALVEK